MSACVSTWEPNRFGNCPTTITSEPTKPVEQVSGEQRVARTEGPSAIFDRPSAIEGFSSAEPHASSSSDDK